MDPTDMIQSGVLLVALFGFGYTYYRNGRSTSRKVRDAVTALQSDIKHIDEALKDPHSGLGAIKESVDEQKTNCANLSGRLDERVLGIENREKK